MELNYTKQRLIDLFVGARDLVLKTITAKQVMMGTKKRGNQIINNSDRLVEKTIDGVQYLGNGYLFIKKGIDKNIDTLFEKYSDMVSAYEYKGRRFYSGKKEDYELVTEIDLRTEQALLKTNKTTQIVTGDDYDRYHAFINSHYYRYFEKIIGSIRLGTPVEPVHMFDKNDEYIGSICPIRSKLEKRKEFFYQPTMEEFLEGEKLEKELKRYHAEQDMETIVTFNQQNVVERAKIMLEEFKDVATSEPKVIKNKKGWYGIGFDTNHKGNEIVVEIFGEKNYKEYQQFWETSFSKELAERLLEKINNNTQEEKEEEKEMTQQYNKTKLKNALNKIGNELKTMKNKTEDVITDVVEKFIPTAYDVQYDANDERTYFYIDSEYTGRKPTKKEMLEFDTCFKRITKIDESIGAYIEETDETIKLVADVLVYYEDKWGSQDNKVVEVLVVEIEKELKKHFDHITHEIENMEYKIHTLLINSKAENCIYAIVETKYGEKEITGLYAGAHRGNESIELVKKLADYFKVEIIDACGLDVQVLDEKEIIEKLIDTNKPCEIVSIEEKIDLSSTDEDKNILKEEEVKVMTEKKNTTTIINEEFDELWTSITEKAVKKIANKKDNGLIGEIKIVDLDSDRIYIKNTFDEEITIRLWDLRQVNKNLVRVAWTMYRLLEGTSGNPLRLGDGYTNIHLDKLPKPTLEKKERMENRNKINKFANRFFDIDDIEEIGVYLKDIGVNPKYAKNNKLRLDLRFAMHDLVYNLSSENKIETHQQVWDLIKDDVKKFVIDKINEEKIDKKEEETNDDCVEVTLKRNEDDKSVKMSDYVKHGLDEFEDKQTGSLIITPAQMKEKTWQGLTVESAVEELLKENKDYKCKLFDEKHIKEPHYVVYRKNTKTEEVDAVDTTIKYTLNKAINSLEGKVEKFEKLMDEMDNLMVNIENLSPMANVMPIMDMQADLFQNILNENKDLQSFKKEIQKLVENTDLFKCSDYDKIYGAITYEECSYDCYENSLKIYVEELKSIAVNLLDNFLEEVKKTKKENEVKLVHSLETLEDVAKLIEHTESGLYTSVTNKGEDCAVLIQRNEGMELQIKQQNGWIRIEEYDKEGHKTLETFNGRWKK